MRIKISNIGPAVSGQDLLEVFQPFGAVSDAEVVTDLFTGASRGFAYLQMEEEAGKKAISELNGSQLNNHQIKVEIAPEQMVHKGSYKTGK